MDNKYPNVIIVILVSLFAIIAVSFSGYWAEALDANEENLRYLIVSLIIIGTVVLMINNQERMRT